MRSRLLAAASVVGSVIAVFTLAGAAADQTLVAAGSAWRYNDSGQDLGTTWRAAGFADAAWPEGVAQLGYGDGDEVTTLSFGGNTSARHITYYFRRTFSVASPAQIAALTLRVKRDDGAVVYLNGTEVLRSNMPAGTITAATRATTAIGGSDENAWISTPVDPARLVAGPNILAVEIHQQSPTSSDVTFDLELIATPSAQPPAIVVELVSPSDDAVVNGTSVTFRANVSAAAGLASAALHVGGAARSIVLAGPADIVDAQLTADNPSVADGGATSINVDGQSPHAHAVMKFPALVGAGAGQLPAGSMVASATLALTCTNAGQDMRILRLTEDWAEDHATWSQRAPGTAWSSPGADGAGSNAGVAVPGPCPATGVQQIDVTRFVQEWAQGAANYGLVFTDGGTDGIDFWSSESASTPVLTVVFTERQAPLDVRPLTGASASVEFAVTLPAATALTWNVVVTDLTGLTQQAPADFDLIVDAAMPDAPVLVSPADGATGVDPDGLLTATVSSPGGGPIAATASLRRASGSEFTIVVLPDTQHYSESFPAIFTAQTQWIVANRAARNIVFVTHEGDIVQNNSAVAEWQAANASLSLLDGVVPYGMAPGNHDQPSTLYNQFFPFTRYLGLPWYGGHYQNLNDNNFQLFSGGGLDFVAVHLEFCPPAGAVAWAKSVFDQHPNRIGMMTTHGYLNESAQRTVHGCANTQYLWDDLGAVTPNLHFMLSGHVHDESRRVDTANGHPVFQMLADYQGRASGGEGWLRILRFVPAEDKVYVQTYSPWLNRFEADANSEFTLDFLMSDPFVTSPPIVVPSGANAIFQPTALAPDTTYEWRVTVTNDLGRSRTGPVWRFTTASGPANQAPTASDALVAAQEDTPMGITVSAADPDGQPITYALVTAPAHGTLSGVWPAVTYQPAANFAGTDTFTFRVSDGDLFSPAATVTIVVAPVNDAPVGAPESYAVPAGGVLTIQAPGVLANDADVEGGPLTAQVVAAPAFGTLVLSPAGGFTYTPAPGYIGPDAFSYLATDGALATPVVTVSLTVAGVPPGPLFSASFTSGSDGFSYLDNAFRGTTQSSYASGSRISSGGYSGGALRVYVGGVNNNTITNMSGGWRRAFTLSAPAAVSLTFRYRLDQGPDYESNEISQMLASLNGTLLAGESSDTIAQVAGNGNGGSSINTGWRQVTIDLGMLPAGTHAVTLGGFNNRKNSTSERTTVLIDDVSVVVR